MSEKMKMSTRRSFSETGRSMGGRREQTARQPAGAGFPAALQRSIGNQAVLHLFHSGVLQAKPTFSRPGDIFEQEADRVADEVLRMPATAVQMKPG